jgi:hypothetical protein
MTDPILTAMLGKADVVTGATITALKKYLPNQPQQQQPQRRVTSVPGDKSVLRIKK